MSKTKVAEVATEIVELAVEVVEEVPPTPPSDHTVDNGSIRPKSSFGRTFYYVDLSRVRSSKGPGQMMGLIRYMIEKGITSPDKAQQGAVIGTAAVAEGYVATQKLTGPVIFAYYIRRMEREQGVEHSQTVHAKTGKKMN